ncbi:MAG: ribosome silencing factor [Candidatus Acidiferrales bacterium]
MTQKKEFLRPELRAAIEAALEKQAAEVTLLDLEGLGAFTNHFILCTGYSARQVEAICDEIERRLGELGTDLQHREGQSGGDWMLMDFGWLIVHVFTEHARRFYNLERLWRAARRIEFDAPDGKDSLPSAAEAEG